MVFCFLILVHEFGHYIFARIFKVEIKEFSIGMGPKIFSKVSKKKDIKYSVRILPIGGYVSMVGENEESEHINAFCNKPCYQRLIITVAGALFNILLGIILMFAMTISMPKSGTTEIAKFYDNAVSCKYGLSVGDKILEIDGNYTPTMNSVVYEIGHSGGKAVDIKVERNGIETELYAVSFGTETENSITFGEIDFKFCSIEKSISNVVKDSFYNSFLTVRMIWDSLFDLITGRYSIDALSGPVGVTTTIGEAVKGGATSFFYLCSMLAMNLGIFNMLPIPALDGGRTFFLLVELLRGKPINRKYEGYIHTIGFMLLIILMIFVTYKDILRLL